MVYTHPLGNFGLGKTYSLPRIQQHIKRGKFIGLRISYESLLASSNT